VHSTARLVRALGRRLADLHHVDNRSGKGAPDAAPADIARTARSWRVSELVAVMWVTQCGLYLVQENLEAHIARRGLPGLSVLGGAHALVPLVHLAVVAVLVAVLWLARRQVTRLAQVVWLAEARLRCVPRTAATVAPGPPERTLTPIDRWGTQLWSRPPPAPGFA
jgi:hypothetical protein